MATNTPIRPDSGFLQETPDGGTEFTTAFRGGFGPRSTTPAEMTAPGVQMADAGASISASDLLGHEPPEAVTPDDLLNGRLDDDYRKAVEEREDARIEEMMLRDAEQAGMPLAPASSPLDFLFENNALFSPSTQAAGIDLAGSLKPKNIAAMTAGGVAKGLENSINLVMSIGDWIDSTGFGVPLPGGVQITDPKTREFDPKFLSGDEYAAFKEQGGTSGFKIPGSGLEADTNSARIAQSFVQFLTGLGIVGKVTGGVATGFNPADVVKRLGQYGLADLAAWDGQEGNLANFLNQFPGLENPVTEFLATDETTPEMEGRFKNALAGLPFNVITEPLLWYLKAIKEARRAKALGGDGQPAGATAAAPVQPQVSQSDAIIGTPDEDLVRVVEGKIGQSPFADLGVPGQVTAKSLLPGSHKADDIAPGMVRVYRAEPKTSSEPIGPNVTTDLNQAQADLKALGGLEGGNQISYWDLPKERAAQLAQQAEVPKAQQGASSLGEQVDAGSQQAGVGGDGSATVPIRAWHISGGVFDKFDSSFAGNDKTGIGGAAHPGAFSFSTSKGISGPGGNWGDFHSQRGIQPHTYEVEITADRNLVPDTGKSFEDQPEGVQQVLLDNADLIKTWRRSFTNSTFNGKPFDVTDPAQQAGVILAHTPDRAQAIAWVEKEYLGKPSLSREERKFFGAIIDKIRNGEEVAPDLFAPGKTLYEQFGAGDFTVTGLPRLFKVVVENGGEEIVVTDPSLIRILSRDGQQLAADAAQQPPVASGGTGQPPNTPPPATAPASQFSNEFKFNWSKIETDDDIKRLWGMMMDLQADQLRAQGVGRKISWKETAEKAGNKSAIDMLIGEGAKKGRALDADALEAAAMINIRAMEDLKRLAEIATAPTATADDLIAFDHMARVAVMAQNLFLPARSEAGRALNILRKVKQSSEQYGADLRLMLERMGGVDTVQGKAQALVDLVQNSRDGGVSAAKATRDLMRARKLDVVREIWINNVFGLKTNMVNFAGNTLAFAQTLAERAVAGQLGKLDPVDGVAVGEATAMLRGAVGAQREALVMFGRAFRAAGTMDGDLFQGSGLDRLKFEVHPYSFSAEGLQVNGSAQGKAVDMLGTVMTQGRLWTRLMGGGDAYFKVINYRAQMRAEAWRKASHEVESGAIPAEKRMERFAEILASPTDGMKQSAGDFAAYNTFTNEPGPAVKKLMELRGAVSHIPGVGGFSYFVAPFIPTPANIWKFAFERTPLAPLSAKFKSDIAKGGAARDLALAKFGLGSIAMSVLYDMAMNGEITGSGPDANFAEKQTAGRLKEKPYSIRVEWGKKADGEPIYRYFAYNRLDPLGVMFGIAADIAEYARNSDKTDDFQFEEAFYAAILAAGENLMNRSYTSGFSGLMDAIDNPQVYGEMYFQRLATSFIPTSVRDVTKAIDPNMKHTHDMVSALKANLPYWSNDIPNRLNLWGEPISYRSGLGLAYDTISPIISTSTEDQAPIDKEFRALEYYPPDTVSIMGDGSEEGDSDVRRIPLKNMPIVIHDFKTAAGATKATALLDMEIKTPDGETVTLDEAMRERGGIYRSYANRLEQQGDKTMKETLNDLVTGKHELSREYHAATVKEKKEMIGDIMRAYRGAARVMVMAKYPELQALRDKMYKKGTQYAPQFEVAPE